MATLAPIPDTSRRSKGEVSGNPASNEVTYFKLIKRQGKKPALSVTMYNKEARLRQMRQRKGCRS